MNVPGIRAVPTQQSIELIRQVVVVFYQRGETGDRQSCIIELQCNNDFFLHLQKDEQHQKQSYKTSKFQQESTMTPK